LTSVASASYKFECTGSNFEGTFTPIRPLRHTLTWTLKTGVTDLEEPVCLMAVVLIEVVEGGHGLGSEVFAAGLDVHLHDRQSTDVVFLSDKEQHIASSTPRRLYVYGS